MKKAFLSIFAVIYIMTILTPFTYANDIVSSGSLGNNVTYVIDSDGTLTVRGTGEITKTLPYNDKLICKKVIINDGVTSIYWQCFQNCKDMVSVTIPESVTDIGTSAFSNCTKLETIMFPNNIKYMGQGVFSGTAWYNNQPDGVVYIGNCVYGYKGTMPRDTSLTLNSGITCIAMQAFYNCSGLVSIVIPQSVKYIGIRAFANTYLNSVEIPSNVTEISNSTFSGCKKLTSVTLPKNLKLIDVNAFKDCRSLAEIEIPEGTKEIYPQAFYQCDELSSVTIPDSLEFIGQYAFLGTAFNSIVTDTEENGLTYLGNVAYYYRGTAPETITFRDGTKGIAADVFKGRANIRNVIMPDSMRQIANGAFANTGITNIFIPNGVTYIGADTFSNCNLKDICYGGTLADWSEIEDIDSLVDNLPNTYIHYNASGSNPPQIVGNPIVSGNMVRVNLADIDYDSSLITVFYNGDTTADINVTQLSSGDTAKQFSIPNGVDTVKTFIWDSLTDMRPLCEAKQSALNN